MPTTINVTQADIDCGFRASCETCPVARALERTTHHIFRVRTDSCYDKTTKSYYNLPMLVMQKIQKYDFGDGMELFPLS